MAYLRSLLMLLLAMLALTSPSMAVGFTAFTGSTAQIIVSADDGVDIPHYRPCERQGGKRALPCHPDLGLLAAMPARSVWTIMAAPAIAVELMPAGRQPATDPPPPRSA
jgi:hypothetical protein